MKSKLLPLAVVLVGLFAVSSAWGVVCTPRQPGPVSVRMGVSGQPPGFTFPADPEGASRMQVEVWKYVGTNRTLFARVWKQASTFGWGGGSNWSAQFLLGSGPGGIRLFKAAGIYRVKWRGWNSCGFGPWSASTSFRVRHTSKLSIRITKGPSRVGSGSDLAYSWSNNFAASRHLVQIRRGSALVRSTNLPGAFRNGWCSFGKSTYRDRPSSPEKELPNGADYVFRVRSYSPILGKWSPWAEKPFQIARGMPRNPALTFSQRDFDGAFKRSPRPYFSANYGYRRTPALWTFYDINRKVGNQLQVVRRQAVSRYAGAFGYGRDAVAGQIDFGGGWVFPDLPAGKYVWRVAALNGVAGGLWRWTEYKTSTVVAAASLAVPSTTGFSFALSGGRGIFHWRAVPNAYEYRFAVWRNGTLDHIYSNDVQTATDFWMQKAATGSVVDAEYRCPVVFPAGQYRFQLQAVNRTRPAGQQASGWSPSIGVFTVP